MLRGFQIMFQSWNWPSVGHLGSWKKNVYVWGFRVQGLGLRDFQGLVLQGLGGIFMGGQHVNMCSCPVATVYCAPLGLDMCDPMQCCCSCNMLYVRGYPMLSSCVKFVHLNLARYAWDSLTSLQTSQIGPNTVAAATTWQTQLRINQPTSLACVCQELSIANFRAWFGQAWRKLSP